MKTKKTKKWICGIFAVLLAAVLLLIGGFVYVTKYKIADIDSSISDDGQYELMFQSVGEPDWPFGYSHARIVLKEGNKAVTKCKFDVANDGGILWPENWTVTWQDSCVMTVISGEEQSDILYTFYYDGIMDVESLDGLGAGLHAENLVVSNPSESAINLSSLASDNENNESIFALPIRDFIEGYNNVYQQYHVKPYLEETTSDRWCCYSKPSPRFGYEAVQYEFIVGRPVWSMPTVSVYASDSDEIYEIRMTFGDHIHQESAYIKYRGLCSCSVKMACPELPEKGINEVFEELCSLSNENFFGDHYQCGDPERPPLSKLLRYENVGFYCFYGSGNIEICMIPLTPIAIDSLDAEGVIIQDLQDWEDSN